MRRVIALLVLLAPSAALAVTTQGTINADETWSGTVALQGDVTVPTGKTLTIAAGTTVTAPSGDSMASGSSTTRTELIVSGTLLVQGTSANPVTIKSASSTAASSWYGIRVSSGGTATFDYSRVQHAGTAIASAGTTTVNNSVISTNLTGISASAGNLTVYASTLSGNGDAGLANNGATANVTYNVITGNCTTSGNNAVVLNGSNSTFDHNTVADSPSCYAGVYAYSGTSVTNNVITSNGSYGIYLAYGASVSASYNDVWNHSTNLSSSALNGAGTISSNPLYVGGTNYRLTSQSPARKADSSGGDLGALPYVSDATGRWLGALYSDTTFQAGQTYNIEGDLTVAAGTTLTIQPGAILKFATTDGLKGNVDLNRIELIVKGTLTMTPGASPLASLKTASTSPTYGQWYGVRVVSGGAATVSGDLANTVWGVDVSGGTATVDGSKITTSTSGVNVTGGSLTLANTLIGTINDVGIGANGGTANIHHTVVYDACKTSGNNAVVLNSGAGSSFDHNTVADSPSCYAGVYAYSGTSVTNNVITSNGSYGIYLAYGASVSASYNDVWNHSTNLSSSALNGTGTISTNPLYVGGMNYRLTSQSPCRKVDSTGGDLGALAYVGDATGKWTGALYADTTFLAGQTYNIEGDLTVAAGTTLTIQPGAILKFATTDGLKANADTARVELIVKGTLAMPSGATLASMKTASTSPTYAQWYGVRVLTGGVATVTADIANTVAGVTVSGGDATVDGSVIKTSTSGVVSGSGTLTLANTIIGTVNDLGINLNGGTANIHHTVVYDACKTSGGNAVVLNGAAGSSFDHNTVADSPSCYAGVYAYSGSSVTNNVITSNGSYGIYLAYSASVSASYNDVWNHSTNLSSSALNGTGTISTNPLYVGGANYRLTSQSPVRKADSSGGDLGALPYISDATGKWAGGLFSNTTFAAGQTYLLEGDLIVASGVTLTVEPGAIVKAATTDLLKANADTSRVELIVKGTLDVQGTSAGRVTFASNATSPAAGQWYGIRVLAGSTNSAVRFADVSHAVRGTDIAGPATLDNVAYRQLTNGVMASAGGFTLSNSSIQATDAAINVSAATSANIHHNVVFGSCTISGGNAVSLSGNGITFDHNTVADNTSCYAGVYAYSGTLTNNIVASSGSYGLYLGYLGSVSARYNDVWGQSTNYSSSTLNGTGSISTNPLFVGGGDYHLQASSPARNVDSSGGDLGAFPYSTGSVAKVVVSPATATVNAGETVTFSAQAFDANNQPVANQTFTFTSTAGAIAQTGVLTATCTPGTYASSVTAKVGNIAGTASVTVTTGPLTTMTVSPANWSMEVGQTKTFTAAGKDKCNNAVTVAPVWSAATAAGAIDAASGLFTASCAPGSYGNAITATQSGVSAKATVTLTVGTLAKVTISPKSAAVQGGKTTTFSASTTDACGNTVSSPVTFSATAGGTIDAATGLFTASATPGTFTNAVKAASNGFSDFATVTVTGGALATITVSPATKTLAVGGTQTFTAVGKDASGNTVAISPAWSTTGGGTINASTGAYTAGTTAGTFNASVVATAAGVTGTADVVIDPGPASTVTLSPATATLAPGGRTKFVASAKDGFGNALSNPAVTWAATTASGTIDQLGNFTATTNLGTYTNAVSATVGSAVGRATITVQAGALATLQLTPVSTSVPVGGAVSFTAKGFDSAGTQVAITPTFTVVNGGGTITAGGVFTAGKITGRYQDTVQASANGVSATATVTVTPGPAALVTVLPQNPELEPGQILPFAAEVKDAFGNVLPGPTITWSAKPEAGTITAEGSFTAGLTPGSYAAAITAQVGNARGTTGVVVRDTALPPGPDAGTPGVADGGETPNDGCNNACGAEQICENNACVAAPTASGGCGCGAGLGDPLALLGLLAACAGLLRRRA